MSNNLNVNDFNKAISSLNKGGVVLYPTESVYGLGASPDNEEAIKKIIKIKQRPPEKGFILIAAKVDMILPFIKKPNDTLWQKILNTWPGPVTWVFEKNDDALTLLSGKFNSLAIRVTEHPIAKKLSELFQKPLISTSANISGEPPVKTFAGLNPNLTDKVDCIIKGDCGNLAKPTPIFDALTGKQLR